jgi:hypothetical protein
MSELNGGICGIYYLLSNLFAFFIENEYIYDILNI